jgi:hypothetical protein
VSDFVSAGMQSARLACRLRQNRLNIPASTSVWFYLQGASAKDLTFGILRTVKPIDLKRLAISNKKGNKNEKSI